MRQIADFHNEIKDADIIHFNAGHWDVGAMFSDGLPFTSLEEYLENLRRIVQELKLITPHLIFATTSPVRDGHINETNEMIQKYNTAAVKLMKELNVRIDDLYPVVWNTMDVGVKGYPDCIHATEEGKIIQGDQVLKVIHEEMETMK